jgi:hypothetical protein
MNRWILGSGAIVTSAIAMYGWHFSSMSSDAIDEGKQLSETIPSGFSASFHNGGEQGIHRKIIPMISNALEFLSFDRQWSNSSDRLPASMEGMYRDLLQQAQTAAEEAQFAKAVTLVSGVPKNSRHYEMAQQLQNDWSQELLQQATKLYQQADIAGALSILENIPPTYQEYARTVELSDRWRNHAQWFEQAMAAQAAKDWSTTIAAINALEGTPLYHSVVVQEALQESISNMLKPDDRLMQIASANLPATAAIPPATISPSNVSPTPSTPPMEPLPSATLPVDINPALEWTPPPSFANPSPGEQPIAHQLTPSFDPILSNEKPDLTSPNALSNRDPKPFRDQANVF